MEKIIDYEYVNEPEELTKLKNLSKTYDMIYKNFANLDNKYTLNDKKVTAKLYDLEDKIYTVGGRKLSDKERIVLEMKRIDSYIQKNKDIDPKISEKAKSELEHLVHLVNQKCLDDRDFIYYFKSKISTIQAYLGLNITFFAAALETYADAMIMNKPTKKLR